MQLVKKLEPEEIAYKLQQFDPGMCTQVFLSELKRVLPSPEEVSVFSPPCKYFILRAEP